MHGHHGFSGGHHVGFGHHHGGHHFGHHIGHHGHHGHHHHHHHNIPVVIPGPVVVPCTGISHRHACGMKMKNPVIPLQQAFRVPFTCGQKLKLKGHARYHRAGGESFVITLGQDLNTVLRLEFNHALHFVTANSCVGGAWGEPEPADNRVHDGDRFRIVIKPEKIGFKIKINGRHFHYSRPILSSPIATYMEISGGVEVCSLKVK